jgi:hypothetical protein
MTTRAAPAGSPSTVQGPDGIDLTALEQLHETDSSALTDPYWPPLADP